ncbi:MAG: hypothetical protein ABSH08_04245 [Tepidisphaeraceae bacterium]
MLKQLKFAATVFALTIVALWTRAPAQTAKPGIGSAAPAPLEPGALVIRIQGTTTRTDAEQLRFDLNAVLMMSSMRSGRQFTADSFALHDGRVDAEIYCHPVGRFDRRSFGGNGGFEPARTSPNIRELATAAQCIAFLYEQFTLAPDKAAWSADQRAARIALIGNELLPMIEAQSVLERAQHISGINPDSLIADRITALRNEIQTVQFSLKAKDIRRTALEMALAQQQKHDADLDAQAQKQDDLVAQLQQLIELRKQQLQALQKQAKAGLAGPAELDAAQAAIAEAQVRLAERISELHSRGSKELNGRLIEELAMVSVDLTELEMRQKDLLSQLDLYWRAQGDPDAMKQLMQVDPDLAQYFPGHSATTRIAAGIAELQQTSDSLCVERFLLSVSALSFTDATPAPPAP